MSCTNRFHADATMGPLNTPALDWRDAHTHTSASPHNTELRADEDAHTKATRAACDLTEMPASARDVIDSIDLSTNPFCAVMFAWGAPWPVFGQVSMEPGWPLEIL